MYFATTSEGKIIANPRFLKHDLAQLRRQQRRLSRKVKGSNNRKKQVQCVARLHQKIKNKRKDFTHKQSTIFVKNHDVIAVEDLHVAGMIRNRRLARSIADVGWRMFLEQLRYKCSWQGKHFISVDRFEPTSKKCSSCGNKQEMPLSQRIFACDACGIEKDRDVNASLNIRAAGLAVLNACGGRDNGRPSEAGISGF